MNQKQLQYFVTVYQTQNIKTAADTLYVSRQGVSKVIRLLEEELGQPLFIRSIKGVIPTDYATTLLPHAKSLLEEYDAIRSLRTLAAKSQSVVTIYAIDHVLAYLGASLIEDFHEAYPSIILSVVDTTDAHAIAALASQQCSFAITAGPLDETRFEGDPLFFSHYSVRMHRSHPLAKLPALTYDDLDGLSVKFYSVGEFSRHNKRGKPPLEWKCYNFRAQIKQRKGFPHGYYNKNWRNLE